jgi:DNA-binding transcriptional ArsR family regulator
VRRNAGLTAGARTPIFVSLYGEMKKLIMREFMYITKALADATRVRILMALRGGELCVCQITELFGMAPSTVSKHLSVLFQAGLVQSRKTDRWVYYRLPGRETDATVRAALAWLTKANENEPQISADNKQIKQILKTDLAEICKRQCKK